MNDLTRDANILKAFFGESPKVIIREIEHELGASGSSPNVGQFLLERGVSSEILFAALRVKDAAAQIDVKIHALGILLSLPHILDANEKIIALSLGAGNTGRDYDLLTNSRVAEFMFIKWQGGSESIRQNRLFKAYFCLSQDTSGKRRQLFLAEADQAIAFLRSSGRSLSSVLSKDRAISDRFYKTYGESRYRFVHEFYADHSKEVEIVDLSKTVSFFREIGVSGG